MNEKYIYLMHSISVKMKNILIIKIKYVNQVLSLIGRIKYFKVEMLKLIIAVLSLVTIYLLSHYNQDAMIAFVMIQAIVTIISSCIDFGSNVYNMNVEHGDFKYSRSSADKRIYFAINTFCLLFVFYVYDATLSYEQLPFLIVGCIGNVFLMRSITIYRRSGNPFKSVLYFEFSLVLLKMMSYPVLIFLGINEFVIFLMLAPFFIAFIFYKNKRIENLDLYSVIQFNDAYPRISLKFLLISASVAFKNQALTLFIPLASAANQGLIVVLTRTNSIVSLACSGISVRLPSVVKSYVSNKKKSKLYTLYAILLSVFAISSISLPIYLPLIASYFNYIYDINYLSYEFILSCLIFFSTVQAANQIFFQSLGKNKLSLVSEFIYISLLFMFFNQV